MLPSVRTAYLRLNLLMVLASGLDVHHGLLEKVKLIAKIVFQDTHCLKTHVLNA